LWAVGTLVALMVTIALLVALLIVNLDAVKWENLSRERIAQVALFIGIAVAATTLIVLLAIGGASLGWTGFADKTLWEWLQLLGALAIPVVLAAAGLWFTAQQDQRQEKIEDRRAESERAIEDQRAQDEALQAYLDQMNTLVLEKNLHNPDPDGVFKIAPGSKVNKAEILARARTLTVLRRLGPNRKAQVLQFLVEAALVQNLPDRGRPVIRLVGADLQKAPLGSYDLHGINLDGADLSNANLSKANLSSADLSYAKLSHAKLAEADLNDADLSYVDLSYANLGEVKGITKEMLKRQAKSIRGATMPDGTVFSDRYATSEFEPAVSFEWVSAGWDFAAELPVSSDFLFIEGPKVGLILLFTNPLHVFDPSNPSEPKELPEPENAKEWVAWLQRHPNLDTSKPVSVSVGDVSGKQIDVAVTSTPENYPKEVCGEQPCVPLYPLLSDEPAIRVVEGWRDRFVIVDVGDETVIIDVKTYTDKFDEFLPKAQKVLDSVEWEGK